MTRIGVVVFPGSNRDADTLRAIEIAGGEPVRLWHEQASLEGCAAIVVPGGFAYGDYLRAGVIARFSPVMRSVAAFAAEGGLVFGICNGFQVIAEAGLVPGALLRNRGLRFLGRDVLIAVERADTPFTRHAQPHRPLRIPIAHGEGCYHADDRTLDLLESEDRVAFRYVDNPNGSARNIAGILNKTRNVLGMMPHPERACDPLMGCDDGLVVLQSMVAAYEKAVASK